MTTAAIVAGIATLILAAAIAPAQDGRPIGQTLADDIAATKVPIRDGYADDRPRLLYGPSDKPALQAKAKAQPELWANVRRSAAALRAVPTGEEAKIGAKYWRIERVQSGALAWFLTGDEKAKDGAVQWMLVHCREPIWGTGYRPNLDLQAAWYLYHIAIAYDTLYPALSDEEKTVIRDGIASHAKALHDSFDPATAKDKFRYDQNHTYIPATALATASLALLGEVPEANDWLTRSYAVLRRCRYVQPEDGYYYEGFGYWSYALHWHTRYADVMSRATGEKLHDLPALRDNWMFALQMQLPGTPRAFDVGDSSMYGPDKPRGDQAVVNFAMLYGAAAKADANKAELQLAGDAWAATRPNSDYPAATFLWHDPAITPAKIETIKPYHHFADLDVVTWRSGWDDDATIYHFRAGPPLGHKAADKLKELDDWTMNAGHVHPDIGAFLMYARGSYLAVTTGYTDQKWTRDHNTLLVNGKGQASDGTYHNERHYPYEKLNACKIDRVHLTDAYGYVRGNFGPAYGSAAGVDLSRTLVMTKDWLLVVDDAVASQQPAALTWICHADGAFEQKDGGVYVAKTQKASLAIVPLSTNVELTYAAEPTTVIAGTAPGKGVPTQRGHNLTATMKSPQAKTRLVHLLIPGDNTAAAPKAKASLEGDTLSIEIDGKPAAKVNLAWEKQGEPVAMQAR